MCGGQVGRAAAELRRDHRKLSIEVSGHRVRILPRRVGQDVRAWPMLALFLAVVLVGIACVLWFMREAMRNERLAVREKLGEAYRGQLAFVQKRAEERWQSWLGQ